MKLSIRTFALALSAAAILTQAASAAQQSTPYVGSVDARPTSVRFIVMAGNTGAEGGFTVEWINKSTYDALGGWPAAGDPAIKQGDFTGVPVWLTTGTAGDYTLPPNKWQVIGLGELFDESGVNTNSNEELAEGTSYVVRIYARANGANSASAPTANMVISTSVHVQNCTFTQGYWKNHPSAWPVTSLQLGTVTYTAAQLLSILHQPAHGNGLVILAHQLIAAKLNIANGADATAAAAAIAAADAQIGGLIVPPVGSGYLSPASVSATATTLDNYNNGIIGPGHCATVPARPATWGSIKSTYRR
jgi:hypothetical protein